MSDTGLGALHDLAYFVIQTTVWDKTKAPQLVNLRTDEKMWSNSQSHVAVIAAAVLILFAFLHYLNCFGHTWFCLMVFRKVISYWFQKVICRKECYSTFPSCPRLCISLVTLGVSRICLLFVFVCLLSWDLHTSLQPGITEVHQEHSSIL